MQLPGVDDIRARLTGPSLDGSLHLLYLDRDGGILHELRVDEGARRADMFFTRYLASLITDVGAPGAVLVVRRTSGSPTRADRTLWPALSQELGPGQRLLGLVVIGPDRAWSAPVSEARHVAARRPASRAAARSRRKPPNAKRPR